MASPAKEPGRSLLASLRPPAALPAPATALDATHHLHPHDAAHPQPSGSILRRESSSFPSDHGTDGSLYGGSDGHPHSHDLNIPSPSGQPRHSALRFQVAQAQSPRSSSSYTRPSPRELLDNDRVIESDSESSDGYIEDEDSSSSRSEDSDPVSRSVFGRLAQIQRRHSVSEREEGKSDSSLDSAFWSPLKQTQLPGESQPGKPGNTITKSPDRDPDSAKSRSSSRHRPRGRLSDAGPRGGRAGSPMPKPQSGESDDGGLDELASRNLPTLSGAGWRSDDPALYEPRKRAHKLQSGRLSNRRFSSGLARPFLHGSEQLPTTEDLFEGRSDGFTSFFRRASEHIPGLSRRPTSDHDPLSPSGTNHSSPVPPILDDTPALARGIQANEYSDTRGGLAHRLEEALSSPSHSDSPHRGS
ncbi:hypothetical protein L202_01340 [Cryptococcus amylolentus CBS 6039]|uniref:Uncharacterized protein n=1 Tax=Cryptococcus amylolentus CBS 6039 TaxID=1295533 RepID=A0A1E3I3K7_9TREE|nr:hypothetical protein L202_01340 [Cryptococcus amylolentus CBS 6039]ODN83139.1 hypothetical protein L202_01340 [Cryptococcus amylolentus CBS 6039]